MTRSVDAQMRDAARDYVESQYRGPVVKVAFTRPDDGYLRCCQCGATKPFNKNISYEEQADCVFDDCLGQMFCNKWPAWADAETVK